MIKKIKLLVTSVLAIGVFAIPAVSFAAAATPSTPDLKGQLCQGSDLQFGASKNCKDSGDEGKLNELIAKIVNIISVIVAIVAVIMIIVGGFKYITSGGDSGNVTGAKNTILYAIIGLVVVALAQFVVKFVLGQSSNLVTP